MRGCNIDSYSLKPQQAKAIPIQILERGIKHTFCPMKLYKDNPEVITYFEALYNNWKTGTSLDSLGLEDTVDTLTDSNTMIRLIEQYTRMEQYEVLGNMLGGSKES